MINRITQLTNDALRERWSTVAILTAILTAGKAYSIRDAYAVDVQGFLAQVFLALVISFLLSMVIHVLLYTVFSPKARSESPAVIGNPGMSAATTSSASDAPAQAAAAMSADALLAEASKKPVIDLHEELGIEKPKAPSKTSAKAKSKKVVKSAKKKAGAKAKTKPVKAKAAKKKK